MFNILQRQMIFPRHFTQPLPHVIETIPELEVVWHQSPEGPVEAWFLPATTGEGPRPLVIFAHGNAELIDYWPEAMMAYRQLGYHVLLPEYRGYGRSAGTPTEAAIREDFVGFYDMITARQEVDEDRVVYHGRSLGGGALAQLASQRPPWRFIMESTFTSIADLAAAMLMPRFMVSDPFDSVAVVEELDCPILILHGVHDLTVPFTHAQELHRRTRDSRLVAFRSAHNDMPDDVEVYWREIRQFLG